jgi:hypothetical protein
MQKMKRWMGIVGDLRVIISTEPRPIKTALLALVLCSVSTNAFASKHCCFKNGGPANGFGNVAACNANPNTLWTSAECGNPPVGYNGHCCMKGGANPIGSFATKQECLSGFGAFNREWLEGKYECPGGIVGDLGGEGDVATGIGVVLNPINVACVAIQNTIDNKAQELLALHQVGARSPAEFEQEKRLCNALKALIIAKGGCTIGAHALSIVELMDGDGAGIVGDLTMDAVDILRYRAAHGGNWPHHRCRKN